MMTVPCSLDSTETDASEYDWPLLPLTSPHFRAWAEQTGDREAGWPYTYHNCPLNRAVRDVLGWHETRTDYNPTLRVGWVLHHDQHYRLPDWAYTLCLFVDHSPLAPTGTQLLDWLDRLDGRA